MTARTDRLESHPTRLGFTSRRPVTLDRSRPSTRSLQSSGRPVFLDMDPLTHLTAIRGSMFEAAAPHRV
ncbi:hypothetical protein [Aureimonas pseudogalii]|jgi:hypothetical protein|uniref:Uncharacterized protein n=1 Tax=Aureimonas pseudogalii TaxID=1744844 RepID=A0A7W6MKW7_9HYPH|nr:hypothetical protein [Aureimonas pseudogalii]MBB3999313.1 hypothetical protein [Aureimonas pseudogalii]